LENLFLKYADYQYFGIFKSTDFGYLGGFGSEKTASWVKKKLGQIYISLPIILGDFASYSLRIY
jgi:hypothetical protein